MHWWMRQIDYSAQSDCPPPHLANEWHKLDTSSPEAFAATLWESNPDAERWMQDQHALPSPGALSELAELADLVSSRGTARTGHGE